MICQYKECNRLNNIINAIYSISMCYSTNQLLILIEHTILSDNGFFMPDFLSIITQGHRGEVRHYYRRV